MTKLLISIRDENEMKIVNRVAFDERFDSSPLEILDVKDPARGALGCVQNEVLEKILETIDSRFIKSIALGELASDSELPPTSLLGQFDFAKIGLAEMARQTDWQSRWLEFRDGLPAGVVAVLVAYIDAESCRAPRLAEVFELAGDQPETPVLIDSFDKSTGSMLQRFGSDGVHLLVRAARQRGIETLVLAGSVRPEQLPALLESGPDYIGVRGAVCENGRMQLDEFRTRQFLESWVLAQSS